MSDTPRKIGILGAGQLGRMLALAGYPLDLEFRFLDPTPDSPARHLGEFICAPYDDEAALARFVDGLDLVTFEFENVPASALEYLEAHLPTAPPRQALATGQDRLEEKTLFRALGIETSPFATVDTRADLEAAAAELGLPAILKTRRFGYDGKGQFRLRTPADLDAAWEALGGVPLILEGFVDFDRELSIIAARGRDGETVFYPLTENHHEGGILRLSLAPAPRLGQDPAPALDPAAAHDLAPDPVPDPATNPALQATAERYAGLVLDRLDYTGILAIELFQRGGQLLANELAPRVHNSGHWTIEGAETSQFENHLRAICGLPLGSTAPRGHAAMLNLIGTTPDRAAVLEIPGAHLHLYGKAPRPGRKLGHITLRADDRETLQQGLKELQGLVE
jgi:5-(carboxyamino)imidazole ribonucleotide synthase